MFDRFRKIALLAATAIPLWIGVCAPAAEEPGSLAQKPFEFTFQGDLSFDRQDGNLDDELYKANLFLDVAKGRWRNTGTFEIDKQETVRSGIVLRQDAQRFEDYLGYQMTKKLRFNTGLVWERDEGKGIKSRSTAFAGFGHQTVNKPKAQFHLFAAAGRERETEFDDTVKKDRNLAYLRNWAKWAPLDKFSLDSKFEMFLNLEETQDYRFDLQGDARLVITDRWEGFVRLTWDYDRQPRPGRERLDTQQVLGLTFKVKKP